MNTVQTFIPSKSTFLSTIICLSIGGLSGCSMFSSGSGDGSGEATLSESEIAANQAQRFGSGNIPTAEGGGMFQDIRFNFDSYAIEGMAKADLENNAKVLSENPNLKVILEGHCDERGTVEYNMALGAERARAVKSMLNALGIPSSRVSTISYGEEIPLDMGHDDAAYAANRRVHFSLDGAGPTPGESGRY